MPERPPVPAHERYVADAENLEPLDLAGRFRRIYETNLWGSEQSRSGHGSAADQTAHLRERLPELLRRYEIRTLLDIPCGDFGWMRNVDLGEVDYTGADIVPAIVEALERDFGSERRRFRLLDLTKDDLPACDLVFCRDCLVHLSLANIRRAFANLRRSGSRFLLTTTFTEEPANADIADGD